MVTMKVDDLQALEPLKVKSYSEAPSELNYVSDFSYCTRWIEFGWWVLRLTRCMSKTTRECCSGEHYRLLWRNTESIKKLFIKYLLYASVRYTCYGSIMLPFVNCIIVYHMFLELYSLYCNDLKLSIKQFKWVHLKDLLGQFWLKEHLYPIMWRNIHDILYNGHLSLRRP